MACTSSCLYPSGSFPSLEVLSYIAFYNMPYIANTPESILRRSDSRNPAVTCRGITTTGRPCRRALASSSSPSPASSPAKRATLLGTELSALFCWQHKAQAAAYATGMNNKNDTSGPSQRSSMDTVIDRLGILDIDDGRQTREASRADRTSLPRRKPRRTFCCFEIVDEEDSSPPKPVPRPTNNPYVQTRFQHQDGQSGGSGRSHVPHRKSPTSNLANTQQQRRSSSRPQPSSQRNHNPSQTQSLLSWVPPGLSPQTTSLLLTELAKPVSDAKEAGYIYMFWVTPSAPSPPPPDIASSLFPPQRPNHQRSVSDAIRAANDFNALATKPTPKSPGTIRLKIGRTSNVQRRLNEWTRQCSHNLTLIRYYPYTPSAPSSSSGRHIGSYFAPEPGRKVPHVSRVERLIHIELNDIRVRGLERCGECNRAHREWFEVAAEKNELRRVEECIRRWVRWGESQRVLS